MPHRSGIDAIFRRYGISVLRAGIWKKLYYVHSVRVAAYSYNMFKIRMDSMEGNTGTSKNTDLVGLKKVVAHSLNFIQFFDCF